MNVCFVWMLCECSVWPNVAYKNSDRRIISDRLVVQTDSSCHCYSIFEWHANQRSLQHILPQPIEEVIESWSAHRKISWVRPANHECKNWPIGIEENFKDLWPSIDQTQQQPADWAEDGSKQPNPAYFGADCVFNEPVLGETAVNLKDAGLGNWENVEWLCLSRCFIQTGLVHFALFWSLHKSIKFMQT